MMQCNIIEVLDVDPNSSINPYMGTDGQYISFYIKDKIKRSSRFIFNSNHNIQSDLLVQEVTPRIVDGILSHYKIDCVLYTNEPNRFLPKVLLQKGSYLIHTD